MSIEHIKKLQNLDVLFEVKNIITHELSLVYIDPCDDHFVIRRDKDDEIIENYKDYELIEEINDITNPICDQCETKEATMVFQSGVICNDCRKFFDVEKIQSNVYKFKTHYELLLICMSHNVSYKYIEDFEKYKQGIVVLEPISDDDTYIHKITIIDHKLIGEFSE